MHADTAAPGVLDGGSASSALDDGHRLQFDTLLTDASRVAGVHHVSHVLVRLGRLLHDQLGRGHPHRDAQLVHLGQNLLVLEVAARLGT